jgi:hypothetical protein
MNCIKIFWSKPKLSQASYLEFLEIHCANRRLNKGPPLFVHKRKRMLFYFKKLSTWSTELFGFAKPTTPQLRYPSAQTLTMKKPKFLYTKR